MVEKPSQHSPLPNRILLLELYEGSSLPQLCDKDCPAVAPVRRPHDVTCKHDQDTSHKVSQFLRMHIHNTQCQQRPQVCILQPLHDPHTHHTHAPPSSPYHSPRPTQSIHAGMFACEECHMRLCKAVRHEGNGYSIHVTDRCVHGGHAIDRPWT